MKPSELQIYLESDCRPKKENDDETVFCDAKTIKAIVFKVKLFRLGWLFSPRFLRNNSAFLDSNDIAS